MSNREHVHRMAEEALDRVAPHPSWHAPPMVEPEDPTNGETTPARIDAVARFLENATMALIAVPVAVAVTVMGAVVA